MPFRKSMSHSIWKALAEKKLGDSKTWSVKRRKNLALGARSSGVVVWHTCFHAGDLHLCVLEPCSRQEFNLPPRKNIIWFRSFPSPGFAMLNFLNYNPVPHNFTKLGPAQCSAVQGLWVIQHFKAHPNTGNTMVCIVDVWSCGLSINLPPPQGLISHELPNACCRMPNCAFIRMPVYCSSQRQSHQHYLVSW